VADYRPASIADEKIKKTAADAATRTLELTQTTDILGSLQSVTTPIKVGFAAETQDIARYAQDKLQRKRLDLIVANDARLALGASDNAVSVFAPDGSHWDIERQPKAAIAAAIVAIIEQRWPQPRRSGTDE
jgi:phosphopantothenoylcysteine decarboxylase/phosphopantothenate--cysteine ligase